MSSCEFYGTRKCQSQCTEVPSCSITFKAHQRVPITSGDRTESQRFQIRYRFPELPVPGTVGPN